MYPATVCFLFFCFLAPPPGPVVPDGQGGFVPFTNSRVMYDGSLRPYNPYFDGVPMPPPAYPAAYQPYPAFPEPAEPPYYPPATYQAPQPQRPPMAPPRPPVSKDEPVPPSRGCYDSQNGHFIGQDNPACRG